MDLFFSPLACSMATRIALYEASAEAQFILVDLPRKRVLADDSDFLAVNGMGQVPTLRTRDGIITENPVVLQYVADRFPGAKLAPPAGSIKRYQLQQWLNFISTELHKQLFIPLLDAKTNAGAKEFAEMKGSAALSYLDRYLDGRDTLMESFTVADAYLVTVLNWAFALKFDLSRWPNVAAYSKRMRERPSVAKAMKEEMELYLEEQKRRKAA